MSAPYVHLEGMGVLGSLLALCLERARVNFTWHDSEEPITAWRASTGCVYPVLREGSKSTRGYLAWLHWLSNELVPPRFRCTEVAVPWFNGKVAPHQGNYPVVQEIGALRSNNQVRSVHVNAQRLVPLTRQKFATRRLPGRSSGAANYIVAHGFGQRLSHYFWGWAVPVSLRFPRGMLTSHVGMRASVYTRYKRFEMAYAYPIPGTDLWYAGSSLIHQRVPKPLDVVKHFARWRGIFYRLTDGKVRVSAAGEPLQGWRPAGAKTAEDKAFKETAVVVHRRGRLIEVPPLYHSGVRHAPLVVEQVFDMLKLPRGVVLP
jgi:hypothetical protein